MMDLSPLRPNEWLDQDPAWWTGLVEARNEWDEQHRSVRAAAENARAQSTARQGERLNRRQR